MPVRSPNMNSAAVQDSSEFPKNSNIPPVAEKEETNENASKEKLNNMKLIMKTFVLGALREKEQVNYYITWFSFYVGLSYIVVSRCFSSINDGSYGVNIDNGNVFFWVNFFFLH